MNTPPLYRYLPRRWVDAFFDTGELRLSSFHAFSKHKDEERKDEQEGVNILTGRGTRSTVFMVTKHGHNAYVLCSSAMLSKSLMTAFGCDACFRIVDPKAFAVAIAPHIAPSVFGIVAPCEYKNGALRSNIGNFDVEQLKSASGSGYNLAKIQRLSVQMAGGRVYLKKAKKYQHQREHRILWLTKEDAVNDHLTVYCPEARQYCSRVDLSTILG